MSESTDFRTSINHKMLKIKALDVGAHLEYSEYSQQWYVEAQIEVGGDGMLVSVCEHKDSPDEAVEWFFDAITTVDRDHYLVANGYGSRRHWRWNGAAFAEQTWTYDRV